jgi:hypothetical protein
MMHPADMFLNDRWQVTPWCQPRGNTRQGLVVSPILEWAVERNNPHTGKALRYRTLFMSKTAADAACKELNALSNSPLANAALVEHVVELPG